MSTLRDALKGAKYTTRVGWNRGMRTGVLIGACLSLFGAGVEAAQPNSMKRDELATASRAAIGSAGTIRQSENGGTVRLIKPERLVQLPFAMALITSVSYTGAAYAQKGSLGIYYLRRDGTGYRLAKSWPEAATIGFGGGKPPGWSVTTKFTRYPAIYVEVEDGMGGLYCRYAELVELTPAGPVHSPINLGVTELRPDMSPARMLRGRVTNIKRGRSFDVKVIGTSRFTDRYVFSKDRFEAPQTDGRLACE